MWTYVVKPHDSASGYIHALHVGIGFSSLQCIHAYVPPVRDPVIPHLRDHTLSCFTRDLCLKDSSSALRNTVKTRFLSCINDLCTNHVSHVIKKTASMASWAMATCLFVSRSTSSVSMILWAISITGPPCSSIQSPRSVLRIQFSLIWWLLSFIKRSHWDSGIIGMSWDALDSCLGREITTR